MNRRFFCGSIALIACLFLSTGPYAICRQGGKPKLVREPVQEDQPEADPDKTPAVAEYNPLKAEKNLKVGKYYMDKGKVDAAVGRFRAALASKPDYPEACRWLARAYEKQKKFKEAATVLLEFETKFPNSPAVPDFKKQRLRLEKKS
jgi:tetratricopeptide (TPR) repeat protein